MMSFRRLLLMENVFDLGDVKVRDAMKPRDRATVLRTTDSWEDSLRVMRESRLSRYPLVGEDPDHPLGVVHVKDLLFESPAKWPSLDMRDLVRPCSTAKEDSPVEMLLASLQRTREHFVFVRDAEGRWTGFVTLEDVLEEIIGSIEDEFDEEPSVFLTDAVSADRVVLDLKASSMDEAIMEAIGRVPPGGLPTSPDTLIAAVTEREKLLTTYVGHGVAIPHARIGGLEKPVLIFARSDQGIPVKDAGEKLHLLFILLSPDGSPKIQLRLLARIGGLLDSEYVHKRLMKADSPKTVLDIIRAGDPVAVDD